MKKWWMFLLMIALLIGCSSEETTEEALELKITDVRSSFGLFQGDPTYQVFEYEIRVENVSSVPVDMDYAEPVILDDVKGRMKESDLRLPIGGVMEKNDFITLKRSFLFKADDLTKEEMLSWQVIEGVMMYAKTGESYFVKLN